VVSNRIAKLAVIATSATLAWAGLGEWVQTLRNDAAIQHALFRPMAMPSGAVEVQRPPSESIPELSKLIAAQPANAELHRLRASEAELAMDYVAAEADWRDYARLSSDRPGAAIALADFYHRRLRPLDEIQALDRAAQAGNSVFASGVFERIVQLVQAQALPSTVANAQYRSWLAREPARDLKNAAARKRFLSYLVESGQYTLAAHEIEAYRLAFPDDAVTPVEQEASLALHRDTPAQALAVYDRAFRPLLPEPLLKSYFDLLEKQGRLRDFLARARQSAQANPEDLLPVARLYYYYRRQNNVAGGVRALVEYLNRKKNWRADELAPLATLFEQSQQWNDAARCWYALYSLPGAAPADREQSLAGIAHILLTAPEQAVQFGAADLSYYKDIAAMDPYPGFLNGILSLLLNSSDPKYQYGDENQKAWPYFHRARASEMLDLLEKQFPSSARAPELRAALIQAYAGYNETDAVIRAATQFLTAYPKAPQRTAVALALADAYASKGDSSSEFAVYNQMLHELAAAAGGVPLGERASPPNYVREGSPEFAVYNQMAHVPPDTQDNQQQNQALSPDYARVLDRYIARLVSLNRVLDAVQLFRRELDRNANDPGLYERLAAFLDQNHMGDEVEQVYRRAVAQFQNPSWSHKLARWYLREQRAGGYAALTRQVVDTFSGTEVDRYFREVGTGRAIDAPLYLELNLYAHQRFPNDLTFVHNLLGAYSREGTANAAAYSALLRQYWFYDERLRAQLFEDLARTGKLEGEIAVARNAMKPSATVPAAGPSASQSSTPAATDARNAAKASLPDPAAARFVAEGEAWRSHFEAAAAPMREVAALFPGDAEVTGRAADLYRSLGAYDAANTVIAATLAGTISRSAVRDQDALARVGDIDMDRNWLARARPWWNRMAAVEPGNSAGYLSAATVYWDYFQYNDALRMLAAGRQKLGDPVLFSYEAGAIYESKRDYARAIAEYQKGNAGDLVAGSSNHALCEDRLLQLAAMPSHAAQVDRATQAAAAAPNASAAAIQLRAAVLERRNRPADLLAFLVDIARRSDSPEVLAWIQQTASSAPLSAAAQLAMQRQVEITHDPVDRIRLQLQLARLYESHKDIAAARRTVEAVYADNPAILGVVRAAVDFYWRNQLQDQAIGALQRAAASANPGLRTQFTLEAARKATDAKQFARARQILQPLLQADAFNPDYLAALAETWALAGDDRALRDFYTAAIEQIKHAPIAAADRDTRTAGLRRGLIPALTRLREFDAATDQYIELMNHFPEDQGLTVEAARYAAAHRLEARLTAYYAKASSDSPKDYRWPTVLARLQAQFEDFPAAIEAYVHASAVRPDRTDLLVARATLQERLMRFADAAATYRRLYELSYRDPQWLEKVAELSARQGRTAEAVQTLEEARIANRPPRAENYFSVAGTLESWNMVDPALGYAKRGMDLSEAEHPGVFDEPHFSLYARLMVRARKTEEAWNRLAKYPNIPLGIGEAVDKYFTAEEKDSFAQFLAVQHGKRPLEEMRRVAGMAGLLDLDADWQFILAASDPASDLAARNLEGVQDQRLCFAELGKQMEALASSAATPERRNQLLGSAMSAYRNAGDLKSEIRIAMAPGPHGGLNDEDLRALVIADPAQLLQIARGSFAEARNQAVNAAIASGDVRLAMDAVTARGQGMPPMWSDALTALTGLYYAAYNSPPNSPQGPDVTAVFQRMLGTANIGQSLGRPVDRDKQLVGDPWFYYGSRYGEYLAAKGAPGGEDYLPAMLEGAPADAQHYSALADSYAERAITARALEQYAHALELDPNLGRAHDRSAVLLWSQGQRDRAIAEWRAALAAFGRVQALPNAKESFWSDAAAAMRHIGEYKLFDELNADVVSFLRAYVRKRQNFRTEEILRPVIETGGLQQALEAAAGGDRETTGIIDQLSYADWISAADRVGIIRKWIALAQTQTATQPQKSAEIPNYRLRLVETLIEAGQPEAARQELATLQLTDEFGTRRKVAEIQIAAKTAGLDALLSRWTSDPSQAPNVEIIQQAAAALRVQSETAAATRILHYLYQRELNSGNFAPANFLGLAETDIQSGDLPAAMVTLKRMPLVSGQAFETLIPAADLLEKYKRTAEAAVFLQQRVRAVPWDAEARLRLARLHGDAVELQSIAANSTAPYQTRAAAAEACGAANPGCRRLSAGTLPGQETPQPRAPGLTGELALLARSNIQPSEAAHHYYFESRIVAARAATGQVRLQLLLDAFAIHAANHNLHIEVFRAAAALGQYRLALAALEQPMLFGYRDRPAAPDAALPDTAPDMAHLALEIAAVYEALGNFDQAAQELRQALANGLTSAERAQITARLTVIDTRRQLEQENRQRMPAAVGQGIEQQKLVRPRRRS
jgi:Flp pilus assembly protein TadD